MNLACTRPKHPFEPSGTNMAMLTQHEDSTFNTTMSYNSSPASFDGTLRALDWMALAKFMASINI